MEKKGKKGKAVSGERLRPPTAAQSRWHASWIFGALLLVFLVYAYRFSPDTLPEYKQQLLAFACALIAGLFGFFLTGDLGLEIHSAPSRIGTISIKATAGFAAFVLVLGWWFSPLAPVKPDSKIPDPPSIAIYRVRVTVLDLQQVPVNDAVITSSVGGEQKKSDSGWEIDIPAANKSADGNVTVYASKSVADLYGQMDVTLDKDPNPVIKIQLREGTPLSLRNHNAELPPKNSRVPSPAPTPRETSTRVQGTVEDDSKQAMAGAWVWVAGYQEERKQTGPDGKFNLAAHAVEDESIQLRVQKAGHACNEPYVLAGRSTGVEILCRRQQ